MLFLNSLSLSCTSRKVKDIASKEFNAGTTQRAPDELMQVSWSAIYLLFTAR
jgi:hypothetical protein